MMKKTISASSLRPYVLLQSSVTATAPGACKARGIPAVCAATAQARRMRGLVPAASNPGDVTWEQLRSGLREVLAELSVDSALALSGK